VVEQNKNPQSPAENGDEYYPLHLDPGLQRLRDSDPKFGSIYAGYLLIFHRCQLENTTEADMAMLGLATEHLLFVLDSKAIGRSKKPDGAGSDVK